MVLYDSPPVRPLIICPRRYRSAPPGPRNSKYGSRIIFESATYNSRHSILISGVYKNDRSLPWPRDLELGHHLYLLNLSSHLSSARFIFKAIILQHWHHLPASLYYARTIQCKLSHKMPGTGPAPTCAHKKQIFLNGDIKCPQCEKNPAEVSECWDCGLRFCKDCRNRV